MTLVLTDGYNDGKGKAYPLLAQNAEPSFAVAPPLHLQLDKSVP